MSNNWLYNDFYKLGIYFSSVFSVSNHFAFYHLLRTCHAFRNLRD